MLSLDARKMCAVLQETAQEFRGHSEELTRLDALIADGDLGVTVELAGKAIYDFAANPGEDDIGKLLSKCGIYINKMSPSTFGTLLAAAFLEAGKACLGHKEIVIKDFLMIGKSAMEGIQKRGKSAVGEKTMLDTLASAVEAFQNASVQEADGQAVIHAGIVGAKAGMESTTNMKATHGRASYRSDKGVGVQDAGATAMYYLIESFGKSVISAILT
jgi:phosphoenolpyruvate---glycerone phosphotransferase subunit DhaL